MHCIGARSYMYSQYLSFQLTPIVAILCSQEQLARLQSLLEGASENTELFDAAETAHNALVEARIIENPHTKLTMQVHISCTCSPCVWHRHLNNF